MEQTMGKRIAAGRKALGLTQDQMAEKLGVTAQAVSKWENDQSCPDIAMLPRLAQLFSVTTDELLGLEPQQPPVTEPAQPEKESSDGKWELQVDAGRKDSLGIATWVILSGGALLFSNMTQREANLWDVLWPSALMVFGLWGLWPKFSFLLLGCLLFGGYFALSNLGLAPIQLERNWLLPIVLLLFGISMLVDGLGHKRERETHLTHNGRRVSRNQYRTEGETFCCAACFAEAKREVQLDPLSRGSAEVSFGELTVDLTGSRITDGAVVDVRCSFGELTLRVPEDCVVENEISTSFGDLETEGKPDPDATKKIILTGSVSFGQICVEYR